jgi:hypothetical protein
VRADHDGASRFQRDEHLIDSGGRRVRGRDYRRHDAKGLGDLDDLLLFDAVDDAHRPHRTNELEDPLGAEEVLLNLVSDHAVTGFFDREVGEGFGVWATADAMAVTIASICSCDSSASWSLRLARRAR